MSNGGNGKERPYYPKDRAEGIRFMNRFCRRCRAHEPYQRTQDFELECLIIKRSVYNKPGDILYPPELVTTGEDDTAATCTAFEPRE